METNTAFKIVAICVICAATLMSGCLDSGYEEKEYHPSTASPSVAPTVAPTATEEKVPYQSPVYKTVEHSEPVYETVEHSEPVYETLATVELRDASVLGDQVYRISHVYDIDFYYSGSDTWGNSEYTVTVYYYGSAGAKFYTTYYQIDEWSSHNSKVITGYTTWSEEVIVGYDTWEEEVIVGYDTCIEEVFSHYETLYR